MSSPPFPSQFMFKIPQSRESPQIGGFQSMSTSYPSSIGRSFGGGYRQQSGTDHIIPGGEFDDFSSSPAQRPPFREQTIQPVFGNNSFGITRYQTSATRGHQPSDSNDSKIGSSLDAPQAMFPGMSITMDERQGSYHPPESYQGMMPSTPVPIPNRGQQLGQTQFGQSWDARHPPPLSSTSTVAYTTAMTPSTGRHVFSYPTMGFHIKNSFESPPSWHFEATPPLLPATSRHVYATPTPASRRPAHLLTTPSSAPMSGKFKHLPTRQLPGVSAKPHFVLPIPTSMLSDEQDLAPSSASAGDNISRRPWPAMNSDVFIGQYETHFGQEGRPTVRRSSTTTKPIKEHRCPTCHKIFARPSALQTHQAVHTGAKPFQCPILICGKRFSVLSNMRRHVRTHERPDLPDSHGGHSGMGYFSSDDYEGNGDESFRVDDDSFSSPPEARYPGNRPLPNAQARSKRRVKQEPAEIAFDSAALGNAAPISYYQTPGFHFGIA